MRVSIMSFYRCALALVFVFLSTGTVRADITLETGNTGAGPSNNALHQQVCVDWHSPYATRDKRCFSFGKLPGTAGVQLPQFSWTWLGWSSWVVGAILKGEVYEAPPVSGATIVSRHTTTVQQDKNWLGYILGVRLGLKDGSKMAIQSHGIIAECSLNGSFEMPQLTGKKCLC